MTDIEAADLQEWWQTTTSDQRHRMLADNAWMRMEGIDEMNINKKEGIDEMNINELVVDGETYGKKRTEAKKYVIVRTYSAGVFAGWLESQKGKEVILRQARRLWYWDGAASLSQLAMEGVKAPHNCKFPVEVEEIVLLEAIEIITATETARLSIAGVPVWKR